MQSTRLDCGCGYLIVFCCEFLCLLLMPVDTRIRVIHGVYLRGTDLGPFKVRFPACLSSQSFANLVMSNAYQSVFYILPCREDLYCLNLITTRSQHCLLFIHLLNSDTYWVVLAEIT
jgi:hypothetical protein